MASRPLCCCCCWCNHRFHEGECKFQKKLRPSCKEETKAPSGAPSPSAHLPLTFRLCAHFFFSFVRQLRSCCSDCVSLLRRPPPLYTVVLSCHLLVTPLSRGGKKSLRKSAFSFFSLLYHAEKSSDLFFPRNAIAITLAQTLSSFLNPFPLPRDSRYFFLFSSCH